MSNKIDLPTPPSTTDQSVVTSPFLKLEFIEVIRMMPTIIIKEVYYTIKGDPL
jgi:hypothetical protein